MDKELGVVAMCNAATEGDVRHLKLLTRCGMHPDSVSEDVWVDVCEREGLGVGAEE